jgi:hypothetical protein
VSLPEETVRLRVHLKGNARLYAINLVACQNADENASNVRVKHDDDDDDDGSAILQHAPDHVLRWVHT